MFSRGCRVIQNRNCYHHHAETATTARPRWQAAPDPAVNFRFSYVSNSGTYRKVHAAIARETPQERKILFGILASRAQETRRAILGLGGYNQHKKST
jgi:hypothetical protein